MEGAAKLRTVPPSRFQRTLTDPERGTCTILDATSKGVAVGPGTPYATFDNLFPGGISIFTEKFTVNGSAAEVKPALSANTSDLTISTSILETSSPRWPARLSTRGANGVAFSEKNGQPAHNLRLHVGNLSIATVKELKFDASGGAGASVGPDSKTAGGDGGKGADISILWKHNLSPIQNALYAFKAKYRLPAKWTEEKEQTANSFDDKSPLLGDLYRTYSSLKALYGSELYDYPDLLTPIQKLFQMNIAEGEKPVDPETGLPLRSVYTVTTAINLALSNVRAAGDDTRLLLANRCLVNEGPAGKKQDTAIALGLNGKDGAPGTFSLPQLDNPKKVIDLQQTSFVFAHPEQCAMVLEKAKTYFYLGTAENGSKAQDLLRSLIERLAFADDAFETASKDADFSTPLLKAYLSFCGFLTAAQASVRKLRQIKARATQVFVQITSTDVDCYGFPADWVPRLSYETFQTAIEKALLELDRTETVYLAYLNEKEPKEYLEKNVNAINARMKTSMKETEEDIASLRTQLAEKYNTLTDTRRTAAILQAKEDAANSLLRLQDRVEDNFELNPKAVLNGLINFASNPNTALAAVQGASLVYEGFTTVPNAAGDPVPKSLLIKQMKKGGNNVAALKKDMLEVGPQSDGSMALDIAFSNKVLVDTAILEQTLDDFADEQFGESGPEAKATLNNFSSLMLARNNDLVQYNVILKTIMSKLEEIKSLGESSAALTKSKYDGERNTAEDLKNMTTLLASIFDNNRQRVMKLLSYLQRALRYKLLSSEDYADKAWSDAQGSDGEAEEAALSMTSQALHSLNSMMSDHLFQVQEKQSSDKQFFPTNFEGKGVGKLYKLTSEELSTLLTRKKVRVRISPVDAEADDDHERSSDFRGCADVRIYRARFWLHGIKLRHKPEGVAKSDLPASNNANGIEIQKRDALAIRKGSGKLVSVKMTHLGAETFIDANNDVFKFRHEPISVTFSYRLYPDRKTNIDDSASGDIVNFSSSTRGTNSVYSAPSPFADWEVSLVDLDLDNLDLSDVDEGVFEFLGSYRSFVEKKEPATQFPNI